MMENVNGLSLDLLVHPGETLKEVLDDRNMTQKELSIRTNYTAKHVSEVISGKKDISSEFANRLEYALDIPASFWSNLQANYDKEVFEINNINNIEQKELNILKDLNEIVKYCDEEKIFECNSKKEITVLKVRKFLNINNLGCISSLPMCGTAFRGSKSNKVNIYVLYAWQKLCEYFTDKVQIDKSFDKKLLQSKIYEIKNTMFLPVNEMIVELKKIFAECGIIFEVVKHFTGAPVQGFIKKNDNKVILCMTIRKSYSDIFWFTLFHEISHLLNEEFTDRYIDYQFVESEEERNADLFARDILINNDDYELFIKSKHIDYKTIEKFASSQNVIPSIVIGRIQNDTNDYSFMSKYKLKYKWIN